LQPIKDHAKAKGMSVNQLVISLLEKDMGIEIATVREQNKQNKERKEAFAKLEQLRKKGIVTDDKAE
jgi:diphthamide synthase (EF-2-diphthine--ammonia ligase)